MPITSTKHDHFIQQFIFHHLLTISHHNVPCKNKLDVLYFVVASFTWLLLAFSKNLSYLRIKTTTIFRQVCFFNLQQGPAVVKLDSTKVGEIDTRQPPYATSACQSVEPVSRKRTCKVGPGLFILQCRRNKKRLVAARRIGKLNAHNCFVFYSCIVTMHKPGSDTTVGERSRNSKFSTHHQDQSMEILATRERGVYLHTLEDCEAEALQEHGRWSRS